MKRRCPGLQRGIFVGASVREAEDLSFEIYRLTPDRLSSVLGEPFTLALPCASHSAFEKFTQP